VRPTRGAWWREIPVRMQQGCSKRCNECRARFLAARSAERTQKTSDQRADDDDDDGGGWRASDGPRASRTVAWMSGSGSGGVVLGAEGKRRNRRSSYAGSCAATVATEARM
jgi:hypothetical protein